jgi:hypothetical protein
VAKEAFHRERRCTPSLELGADVKHVYTPLLLLSLKLLNSSL